MSKKLLSLTLVICVALSLFAGMTFFRNFAKWCELDVTVSDTEKAELRAKYSDFKNVSGYA